METRVSIIGIIVENTNSVDKLNDILHQYGNYIIGRMGIPYSKKNVERVHIKRASKIIANMITERKIESSLS